MMPNEKQLTRFSVALLAAGLVAVGYKQMRAHADGVPTMNPMTYSGTLEDGGQPVAGSRNFRLTLWDDPRSTDSSRMRCVTTAPNTPVTAGRFQVALDNSCTPVVFASPNLWVELEVNGSPLPRTRIGAVPFALEAARAADLSPAARNALVPAGTVVAFAGTSAPAGWALCNGSTLNRTQQATLFASIGTIHGSGDGTTTFNLPDYRGRFLRGADLGVGRDPDRTGRTAANPGGATGDAVGTVQPGATAMPGAAFASVGAGAHSHTLGAVGDHTHPQFVSANPNTGGSANRIDFDGDVARASAYSQGINTGGAGGHNPASQMKLSLT